MGSQVDGDEERRAADHIGQDRPQEMAHDELGPESRAPGRRRESSGEQPDEPDALPAEAAYVSPEREGNQEDDEQRIDLVHGHPPGPTGAAGPGVERRGGLDRRAGGAA